MVLNLMKWIPWNHQLSSKKFEAKIIVHRLTGLNEFRELEGSTTFSVEIKWKGSKDSLRRSLRRNLTRGEVIKEDGVVYWNEEFRCFCKLSTSKNNMFHPWEASFTVFTGLSEETGNDFPVFSSVSLNLAELTGKEISIPVGITRTSNTISLHVSVNLLELRSPDNPKIRSLRRYPFHQRVSATTKDMSSFRGSSPSDSRNSETSSYSGSFHEDDESESDSIKEIKYGTIAYANQAGALSSSEDEDLIYYSNRVHNETDIYPDGTKKSVPVTNHTVQINLKLLQLRWSKRKSSSSEYKGEPLLKKYHEENGGDDIDFDRRQVSPVCFPRTSLDYDCCLKRITENSSTENLSEFEDDNFTVGTWENKEIISRDGVMKMKTQVFFASIDQRSESVAGESACTTLVAVITDWFHRNMNGEMPVKSQLDALIREGSREWRNLCEKETYSDRFPDKHFDLETVLEAKIRQISVIPDKSFVGFFHPEGIEQQELHFLEGAMSFDSIWDEICESATRISPSGDHLVYIISWNDHFFVLKVEATAYYIIDTLGERLYEGCDQAYILKFDEETVIRRIAKEIQNQANDDQMVDESKGKQGSEHTDNYDEKQKVTEEGIQVCTGKECCREYIKSFLAAIPIRELQDDLKKGLIGSTRIHHRLQIECHYTTHC